MDLESKKLLQDIKSAFAGHNDTIIKTIEKTVNGKIDRLTVNFNEWKEHETDERLKIKTDLENYMARTEPMVKFFEEITSSKKVLFWLLGGLGTIGGFWLLVREIFFSK